METKLLKMAQIPQQRIFEENTRRHCNRWIRYYFIRFLAVAVDLRSIGSFTPLAINLITDEFPICGYHINFIFDPINTKYSSALHVPSLLSSFIFHPCENSISRYINCMPDVASPRSLSLFFFFSKPFQGPVYRDRRFVFYVDRKWNELSR